MVLQSARHEVNGVERSKGNVLTFRVDMYIYIYDTLSRTIFIVFIDAVFAVLSLGLEVGNTAT